MSLRLILINTILIQSFVGFAFQKDIEGWKPDLELIMSKFNESDSSLPAKMIFDFGKCTADPYSGTKFTQHRRIKIYKKSAFRNWANFEVTGEFIRLINFKCQIFNYENGQIVTTSLDKEDLLKDEISKRIDRFVLALPTVKEGSVIEYEYSIKSDIYTIRDWDFQHTIPIDRSEYELFFPGSLNGVTAAISGVNDLADKTIKQGGRLRKYTMVNLPAFEAEPNMPHEHLYKSSILFRPGNQEGFKEIYVKDILQTEGLSRDSKMMDTQITGQITLALQSTGVFQGELIIAKSGYEAITGRKAIKNIGSDQFLKSELNENNWTIIEQKIENEESPDQDLILRYTVNLGEPIKIGDSLIYITPNIVIKDETNPFKLETRTYPLDLGSRIVRSMTVIIKIPEGYTVEELPKSTAVELPDKSANYAINISKTASEIFITSRLKFNKIIYNVSEYPNLRAFIDQLISKRNEPVILKKEIL